MMMPIVKISSRDSGHTVRVMLREADCMASGGVSHDWRT
jgi:hypothetical protein